MKKLCWCIFASFVSLCAHSQWTTSGTNIYNSNTGFVGIGLTNPLYPLHIQSNTSGGGRNFYIQNSAGVHCFSVDNAGDAFIGSAVVSGNITIQSAAAANMSFCTMGTTTPALIFYSYGGADGSNYSVIGNHSAGIALDTRANVPPFKIQTLSGGVVTDAFSVFNNNNISIGTNNAVDNGNRLQVNGNLWTTGFKLPTGAAAGKVLTSDASGNATWQTATGGGGGSGWALNGNTAGAIDNFGTIDNYDLPIITNNIERMRVTAGGSVAIGTTDPKTYKLAVNGSAIFTSATVKLYTNWPDYVFDKEYRLPSLESLSKYIAENKHLPDMPSAETVAKDGIDLGANQTATLKKVEELTLYIIQQDKAIQDYKQKLEDQERRLERLEKMMNK